MNKNIEKHKNNLNANLNYFVLLSAPDNF